MKTRQFKEGERVLLHGRGPPMDVLIASETVAYCEWFEGSARKRGVFRQERLQPYTPQPAADPSRAV